MNEKNVKITKWAHAFKGYASSYNTEILNSVNPELKFKDPESAIENKLKKSLTELRGFKFMATLVLVLKKIESEDKTKSDIFYTHSKPEAIINESDINDVFNLYYSYMKHTKIFRRRFRLDYWFSHGVLLIFRILMIMSALNGL